MKKAVVLLVFCVALTLFPVMCQAVADTPQIGDPTVTKTEHGWDVTVKYEGSTPQKIISDAAVETTTGTRSRSSEKPLPRESFKDGRIRLFYPQVDPRMIRKIEWTFKIVDAEGKESNPVKVVLE